ncbi:hypothetical protein Tco_1490679 [Tanacetum coccineum]
MGGGRGGRGWGWLWCGGGGSDMGLVGMVWWEEGVGWEWCCWGGAVWGGFSVVAGVVEGLGGWKSVMGGKWGGGLGWGGLGLCVVGGDVSGFYGMEWCLVVGCVWDGTVTVGLEWGEGRGVRSELAGDLGGSRVVGRVVCSFCVFGYGEEFFVVVGVGSCGDCTRCGLLFGGGVGGWVSGE